MKTIIIFMAVLLYLKQAFAETQIYFSPSSDCENQIIKRIDNTTQTLDIAVYSLTSQPLADAILRAKKRGVEVRVLTDRVQSSNQAAQTRWLDGKGINIRVHSRHRLMHNKIAVFDSNEFVTGSYNWTKNAKESNAENCLFVTEEPETLDKLKIEFEKLWRENSLEKHKIWIRKGTLK